MTLNDLTSILPYAVGAAAAAPIVAVITALILSKGSRPILGSWVFTFGAGALDAVVATVLVVAFWGTNPSDGSGSNISAYIDIVLGLLFLAIGLKAKFGTEDEAKQAAQRRKIEGMTQGALGKLFVLGIIAQIINIDALTVFAAGLKEIPANNVSVGGAVVMVAVALVVMLIPYYGPIILYVASGESGKAKLAKMTEWLFAHDTIIEIVVGIGFGALFLIKGFTTL